MEIKDIMTQSVVSIDPNESVEVAARTMSRHNIGALPVCGRDGGVCGVVTDRDLVTRCMAANKPAGSTTVRQVMSGRVLSVKPDMDVSVAAHFMGKQQIRRLPVVEDGKVCGILSLGDIAGCEEAQYDAADALTDITSGIRKA